MKEKINQYLFVATKATEKFKGTETQAIEAAINFESAYRVQDGVDIELVISASKNEVFGWISYGIFIKNILKG